jgi:hypothetical protein
LAQLNGAASTIITYKLEATTFIFFTVYAKKWKEMLGRIQNKMKIIHVSNCVVLVDEKKKLFKDMWLFYSII